MDFSFVTLVRVSFLLESVSVKPVIAHIFQSGVRNWYVGASWLRPMFSTQGAWDLLLRCKTWQVYKYIKNREEKVHAKWKIYKSSHKWTCWSEHRVALKLNSNYAYDSLRSKTFHGVFCTFCISGCVWKWGESEKTEERSPLFFHSHPISSTSKNVENRLFSAENATETLASQAILNDDNGNRKDPCCLHCNTGSRSFLHTVLWRWQNSGYSTVREPFCQGTCTAVGTYLS